MNAIAPTDTREADLMKVMTDLQDENLRLSQELHELEQRDAVTRAQLDHLSRTTGDELATRLRIGVALDDPETMSGSLEELADRTEAALAALTAERDEARAEAAATQHDLEATQRDLDAARQHVAAVIAERDEAREWGARREAELLSSTSWRITAPIRALSRGLRGLRR